MNFRLRSQVLILQRNNNVTGEIDIGENLDFSQITEYYQYVLICLKKEKKELSHKKTKYSFSKFIRN